MIHANFNSASQINQAAVLLDIDWASFSMVAPSQAYQAVELCQMSAELSVSHI